MRNRSSALNLNTSLHIWTIKSWCFINAGFCSRTNRISVSKTNFGAHFADCAFHSPTASGGHSAFEMFLNFIFDYRFNLRREKILSIEKKLWVLSIMIFYYLLHLHQVIFLALLLNWKLVHAVSPHIAAQHAPVIPLACTRFEHLYS